MIPNPFCTHPHARPPLQYTPTFPIHTTPLPHHTQVLYEKQCAQLSDIIEIINGELSSNDRKKLITLCTVDVHARDVVQRLIDEKTENANCFQWQSQMRYVYNTKLQDMQVGWMVGWGTVRWGGVRSGVFVQDGDVHIHTQHVYIHSHAHVHICQLSTHFYCNYPHTGSPCPPSIRLSLSHTHPPSISHTHRPSLSHTHPPSISHTHPPSSPLPPSYVSHSTGEHL